MSLSSDGLGPVVHIADTIAIGGLDSCETTVSPASAPGVLDDPDGHAIGNGLDDDWLALRVDLLLDLALQLLRPFDSVSTCSACFACLAAPRSMPLLAAVRAGVRARHLSEMRKASGLQLGSASSRTN